MAEPKLISADSHVNEHSRDVVERDFKDVPAKDKRQIVRDNAARLYGFGAS